MASKLNARRHRTPGDAEQTNAEQSAAFTEIDAFATKLLALNAGRPIPRKWKQRLMSALQPGRTKRGRKFDPKRYAAIVRDLVLLGDKARTARTKQNNPADHKREIAMRHGVSLKTVDRIESACCSLEDLVNLPPERRKARIEGLADAIVKRLAVDK